MPTMATKIFCTGQLTIIVITHHKTMMESARRQTFATKPHFTVLLKFHRTAPSHYPLWRQCAFEMLNQNFTQRKDKHCLHRIFKMVFIVYFASVLPSYISQIQDFIHSRFIKTNKETEIFVIKENKSRFRFLILVICSPSYLANFSFRNEDKYLGRKRQLFGWDP